MHRHPGRIITLSHPAVDIDAKIRGAQAQRAPDPNRGKLAGVNQPAHGARAYRQRGGGALKGQKQWGHVLVVIPGRPMDVHLVLRSQNGMSSSKSTGAVWVGLAWKAWEEATA
ncbi:MAG: hypothetical protein WAM94_21020, partial [Chromatiaceae bacterium]